MSNPYKKLAKGQQDYGAKYGEECTVSRVGSSVLSTPSDYSVANQSPNIVYTAKFYLKQGTNRYPTVKIPDVEIYTVVGKGVLKTGDIISPAGVSGFTSTSPIVTIFSKVPIGDYFGFKTDKVGSIYHGDDVIFSNIKFSYMSRSSFPGAPLDREIKASMNIPAIQVATYTRPLRTSIRDAQGLLLHQTDVTPNVVWEIVSVTTLSNIDIYDLKWSHIA